MQITLSAQQSKILESLSQQGGYSSLDEAIDTALILLADEIAQHQVDATPDYLAWVEHTRHQIEAGIQDAEQGRLLDGAEVLAQLRQKVDSARSTSA